MPRDSNGIMTLPAGQPVVPTTPISASVFNALIEDLRNEIQLSLGRFGYGGMIGPLPLADGITAGLTWDVDTNTRLYRAGANDYRFNVAGAEQFRITNGGVRCTNGINMNGAGIVNLVDPTNAQDASTKAYCDTRGAIIAFGTNVLPAAPSTTYLFPWYELTTTDTIERFIVLPYACTVGRLFVYATAGGTVDYTVRKNGVDTAIAVSTASAGSDTSNTVSLAAGDRISIKAGLSSGASPSSITATLRVTG